MKKEIAGIYCRLSEEDRNKQNQYDDSESIQNQKSMLIKYALERGWEIYRIYCDEDYTGADRNRPEFNHMLKDAEEGKINIVLCKTQSRFSRELEIVERYIHGYFLLWNVRFVGMVDNADTAVRGNKKARQINGLVNEWYLEDLSESIKSVLDDKRSKGLHIGSSAVYGYKKDPESKGHLIIDPPAAAIVREIFQAFASGMGKTEITRQLNNRGIPNPSEYKRIAGLYNRKISGKNGTKWCYATVSRILSNDVYIGNLTQGKSGTISYKIKKKKVNPKDQWFCAKGTHEPIIGQELWDKVQGIIAERATPAYTDGRLNIFAKKVRCAHCGYTMHAFRSNCSQKYFRCPSKVRGKDLCIGAFIPQEYLEKRVLEEMRKVFSMYLLPDEAEDMLEIQVKEDREQKDIRKEIQLYQKKIEENDKILAELYADKVRGEITIQEFHDLSQRFAQEKEVFQNIVRDGESRLQLLDIEDQRRVDKKELIKKYSFINELNYDIIHMFIEHIEVAHRKSRQEEYPIKIYWKF